MDHTLSRTQSAASSRIYGERKTPNTYKAPPSTNTSAPTTLSDPMPTQDSSHKNATDPVVMAIAMNALLITAPHIAEVNSTFDFLSQTYSIRNLGPAHHFLGWTLKTFQDAIHIGQPTPIEAMVKKANLEHCNPRETPLPSKPDFNDSTRSEVFAPTEKTVFQSTLGKLRYIADSTRFEIAFDTSRLASYLDYPTVKHRHLLHHIIRYLKRTKQHGILN